MYQGPITGAGVPDAVILGDNEDPLWHNMGGEIQNRREGTTPRHRSTAVSSHDAYSCAIFVGDRAGGTFSDPTPVLSGWALVRVLGTGLDKANDPTAIFQHGGSHYIIATENWGEHAHGTKRKGTNALNGCAAGQEILAGNGTRALGVDSQGNLVIL